MKRPKNLLSPLLLPLVATLLVAPAVETVFAYEGCGWDDGPFPGEPLNVVEASGLTEVSYVLRYRRGTIEIYNRSEQQFPVVVFRRADRIVWAVELSTHIDLYTNTHFARIEHPRIQRRLFGTRLTFTGYWTYGAEAGSASISPRSFGPFCLSW